MLLPPGRSLARSALDMPRDAATVETLPAESCHGKRAHRL
jgi:hypothetical protein